MILTIVFVSFKLSIFAKDRGEYPVHSLNRGCFLLRKGGMVLRKMVRSACCFGGSIFFFPFMVFLLFLFASRIHEGKHRKAAYRIQESSLPVKFFQLFK